MTPQYVIQVGREAITVALSVAAPMLALGLIVGLIVAILQAVTQIHEMTLTFIPKILAVLLALTLFMPWMLRRLTDFATALFMSIPSLGP